ncbi:LAFE_0G01970g1_1 [Lachancea fermentati]|uniref:Sterol 3-beta-glucosyltransferase n=1 Tax=Lachancea fermentati TaxID=4955 RepID=A0A1G4MGQ9_LACFM|nr:LAFE_0G01970g1_1 [Lachancea fermentati]
MSNSFSDETETESSVAPSKELTNSSSKSKWRNSKWPVGKMYHSVSNLANLRRESTSNETIKSGSTTEETTSTKEFEDDLARPCGMAKSIVGLLTTASVYAGMGEIEQAEDICEDENDNTDSDSDSTIEETSLHSDAFTQASRKDTLFEISIEPNEDARSLITSSSKYKPSKLFKKLSSRFDLDEEKDLFITQYSCWLLKDVLIQGHIFLTTQHLLFFAFLPKSNGTPKLSGNLTTFNSGSLGARSARYWAVLKDHTLSFYSSPKELYFPILTIDLRYTNKIEVVKEDGEVTADFKIYTDNKTFKFRADSEYASRSWCSALKKQVFASQHSKNDFMSIKIPLANIIDIDEQLVVAETVTLRVRVLESSESYAIDDYFFMFFNKSGITLKKTINVQLVNLELNGSEVLMAKKPFPDGDSIKEVSQNSSPQESEHRGRSLSTSRRLFKRVLSPVSLRNRHALSLSSSLSPRPPRKVKERLRSMTDSLMSKSPGQGDVEEELNIDYTSQNEQFNDEENLSDSEAFSEENHGRSDSPEGGEKPHYSRLARWTPRPIKNMGSMWSAHPVHYQFDKEQLFPGDDEYLTSSLDQQRANQRFKSHFSLDDDESLRAAYYTYLNKNIPIYGKLYLGKSVVCFRSLIPRSKTRMILPIKDLENCYKERGFRFGYFGLVLVIHGHEELFFEFSLRSSRDDAEFVLLKLLDIAKPALKSTEVEIDRTSKKTDNTGIIKNDNLTEAAKVKLFEDKINAEGFDVPFMIEESPYYKTSITPKKSYRFGLLTIGSRGDVQPYIALGKGLVKEGHTVTIITHEEFKDWIKSHGLMFKKIAGNPAELMSLMVQHGSMNVGLLREASTHFRGWIQQLLETSWQACQNLDILIESPSAMAGIHIAEALGIPYVRAFTMPWTRTRAYPHAFIVPDQKRGGNYNYLTHVLFENIFWKGVSGQVNKWRVETLGLEKTNLDLLQQNKVPFLYNISPTIFPPSVDFSEWVKVTGYWFLDEKSTYAPPAALIEFITKARRLNKKLVYIGFGSIVVNDPKEMTKAVVDAVVNADVFCILNKGWSERLGGDDAKSIEIELPECVYNSGSVPHDWLFPQIDAAVHHGGSGTTGATLRAGLPTIIKPFFGDQFFYAGRVEDIGAGISLKKLNSETLSRALKEITTNSRIINKAHQIKEAIAKENGIEVAISCIYSELEYARSLILAKRRKGKKVDSDDSNEEDSSWFLV